MRIAELWRYPVKSLQGERLESAQAGDERRYENPVDFEQDEPTSAWGAPSGRPGAAI